MAAPINTVGGGFAQTGFSAEPNISPFNQSFSQAVLAVLAMNKLTPGGGSAWNLNIPDNTTGLTVNDVGPIVSGIVGLYLNHMGAGIGWFGSGGDSGGASATDVTVASNAALNLYTNGSRRLTVSSGGTVTVNATAASSLIVNSSGYTTTIGAAGGGWEQITLVASGATGAVFRATDSSGNSASYGMNSAAQGIFRTNNADRIVINQSGNVTVNAPTSGNALTVDGYVILSQAASNQYFQCLAPAATEVGGFVWSQTSQNGWQAYQPASSSDLRFYAGGGHGDTLVMTTNGNVTINAPSSGDTLTVNQFSTSHAIYVTGGTNPGMWASDGTVISKLQTITGSLGSVGTESNHEFDIRSNNTSRITVAAGGNVTVNAPASGNALTLNGVGGSYALLISYQDGVQVSGPAATQLNALTVTQSGQTQWQIYQPASSNDLRFYGGSDRMTINGNGQVTINSPASGYALSVTGVSGAAEALYVDASTNPTAGIVINASSGSPWAMQWFRSDLSGCTVSMYNASPANNQPLLNLNNPLYLNGTNGGSGLGYILKMDSDHATGIGIRFNDTNASPQSYDIGIGVGIGSNNWLNFYNRTGGAVMGSWASDNKFLINQTSESTAGQTHRVYITCTGAVTEYGVGITCTTTTASSTHYMTFGNGATEAGKIQQGASASTCLYTTSSDYRLKTNVAPLTGGLATVMAMQPRSFTWIQDGVQDTGFIAHELQAVVPHAVSYTKDVPGRIQGVDKSQLVQYLVAAIQEQQKQIAVLQAKLGITA